VPCRLCGHFNDRETESTAQFDHTGDDPKTYYICSDRAACNGRLA
jgi:hypothetical protein